MVCKLPFDMNFGIDICPAATSHMPDQAAPARPRLLLILSCAAILLFYLLYAASNLALIIRMHSAPPPQILTATHELPQSDFAMFWYSGKLLLMNAVNAHGGDWAPNAWMQRTFQANFTIPGKIFHLNWMYPPTMGLLAMLYAAVPLALSFWVWRTIFLLAGAVLLRQAGLSWAIIVMGLVSPAEWHDMLGGQNGALTGSLLVASLFLIEARPRLGGTFAGLLCIKPQIGLMMPMILLNRGRAPALLACVFCVGLCVLLTLPLEGWKSWTWFLSYSRHAPVNFVARPFAEAFPAAGITVFFMARSLHAGVTAAWVWQAASSTLAALAIWRIWRHPAANPAGRIALSMCLWVLLTPYGYLYDLVGFSIAMAAMFMQAPDQQKPLYGLLWLSAGYTGTLASLTGIIWMPAIATLGAGAIWSLTRGAPCQTVMSGKLKPPADYTHPGSGPPPLHN